MSSQSHGSSSHPECGQPNQQVRSSDFSSAMGNISGGIMRFNLSAYKQVPDVDRIRVHNKKGTHQASRMHDDQVAPDVKGESSPLESAKD